MRFYKVVDIKDGVFVSSDVVPKLAAHYEVGQTTTPPIPGSKLFVFGGLEHAQEWADNYDNPYARGLSVFEVDVVGTPIECPVVPFANEYEEILSFWNGGTPDYNKRRYTPVAHAYLVDGVVLKDRVSI